MHIGLMADYWMFILGAIAVFLMVFVLVAGRGAEGGLLARSKHGWSRWQAVSKKTADVQARVALTALYFTFVAPFGLARTFLADPLQVKRRNHRRAWHPRATRDLVLEDARKQF